MTSIFRTILSALVLGSLTLPSVGAASAQVGGVSVLKGQGATTHYRALKSNRALYALTWKSCLASYNPTPSSPGMYFPTNKTCSAPSSAPDGSKCGCAVTIEGRSGTAWGVVYTESSLDRSPVVR